jgi:multisubunit Na+/H+ antiporter MnhE subunit
MTGFHLPASIPMVMLTAQFSNSLLVIGLLVGIQVTNRCRSALVSRLRAIFVHRLIGSHPQWDGTPR